MIFSSRKFRTKYCSYTVRLYPSINFITPLSRKKESITIRTMVRERVRPKELSPFTKKARFPIDSELPPPPSFATNSSNGINIANPKPSKIPTKMLSAKTTKILYLRCM